MKPAKYIFLVLPSIRINCNLYDKIYKQWTRVKENMTRPHLCTIYICILNVPNIM